MIFFVFAILIFTETLVLCICIYLFGQAPVFFLKKGMDKCGGEKVEGVYIETLGWALCWRRAIEGGEGIGGGWGRLPS